MSNNELIKAATLLQNHCTSCKTCQDCMFEKLHRCLLHQFPNMWELPEINCNEPTDNSTERIAELHRQVDIRDRRIEELEQQLVIKDSIIKKQGVLLADMQEQQFKERL